MNSFEKILSFLQGEMSEPKAFGLFHILWLILVVISIIILYKNKKNYNGKQLKKVLAYCFNIRSFKTTYMEF